MLKSWWQSLKETADWLERRFGVPPMADLVSEDPLAHRRKFLEGLIAEFGLHHPETEAARANLVIEYRRQGRDDLADALLDIETGICEDLRGVENYIRSRGAQITDIHTSRVGTAVTFGDVVLDAKALKKRFKLPDHVTIHTYGDVKSGVEHGLKCTRHGHTLIGADPDPHYYRRVLPWIS